MSSPKHLDDLIHAKVRLGIMSMLMVYVECDFTYLKERLGITDGNLGSHLQRLDDANYIEVTKTFVNNRPKSIVKATEKGVIAYKKYIETLESILNVEKE